jgi:hypothetical protein
MKVVTAFLCVGATLLIGSSARAADRLSDRDVMKLVEQIDDGRDRFEDNLDSDVKHRMLRGPSGEVDVEAFLHDFNDNVDRLKDRFKPDYAASNEAGVVLRQASTIDRYIHTLPTGTRGESEWNRLVTDLRALATAYGTTFPLSEGAAVRRVGDGELASTVEQVEKAADGLKKSLDDELKPNLAVDKQSRDAIVDEAEGLQKDAEKLRERIKDGEPSSSELDKVLERATRIQRFLDSHQVPASARLWSDVTPRLRDVASAYVVVWPR